ncbi:MAG: M1 family aminopeptidase [Terriglobia bacterium]|nr:M1 family aminopeptidase [Terriglobia bacterium]
MLLSMIRYLLVFLLFASAALAQVPEGIPRQLARERAANVSDVHYKLSLSLAPHATDVPGSVEITFTLKQPGETLLDYRDGVVKNVVINGQRRDSKVDNGHIVLPTVSVHAGQNTVEIEFTSHAGPAGKPIIQYEDKDDGSEYVYTLFVPMDASMAFPCFDQPDIKGRFQLNISVAPQWTVISNTAVQSVDRARGVAPVPAVGPPLTAFHFGETLPLPTYLVAFAAGPFRKIEHAGEPTVYFRKSELARAQQEVPELQEITAKGIKFLSDYFAQPFPFPKYDLVLIPGMAYGGMEHAGATFLREESVLFRTATTHSDILGRDILTLHELTHQWFGDLVTMRWFDDLWLKEGFAQFMAYRALSSLRPEDTVWKRFYETIKPGAYGIDQTLGTTPIYQDIGNLNVAKSAYGAIVYSKAPGVLKQLWYVLGDEHFRDGLRAYLKEHAYSNAEWSDLVHAFEQASGRLLGNWADTWIRKRGMPEVDVAWSCRDGRVQSLTVTQHDVLNEGVVWPIAIEAGLHYPDGSEWTTGLEIEKAAAKIERPFADGQRPCPAWVFANENDYAYGRFLLDEKSKEYVMAHLGQMSDPFERALLWGSLWESVQVADLDPRRYIELATRLLPKEKDEMILAQTVGRTAGALHRYVSEADRHLLTPPLDQIAATHMQQEADRNLRIVWFRGFRALTESAESRERLKALLNGSALIPGITLRPLDRWNMVTTLVALDDPDADKILALEKQLDHTTDGQKYAYMAGAARPDAATKKRYFDDYLDNPERPEDWVQTSLGAFNYWNQSAVTQPYLEPALQALPQVKRDRKIFFLVAWLDAFIGGQQSANSDEIVHHYLDTAQIEPDTRLKILQAVDELDRTVKIRKKYAGAH